VARQCQQLPRLHGGELRRHRRQRERIEAPARGLFQQGAEPVQRAECTQIGCGFCYKGGPDDVWGEGIRFQAVGLARNPPSLAHPVGGLAALGERVPAQGDLLGGEALRTNEGVQRDFLDAEGLELRGELARDPVA
jgi:hypothetical protein